MKQQTNSQEDESTGRKYIVEEMSKKMVQVGVKSPTQHVFI